MTTRACGPGLKEGSPRVTTERTVASDTLPRRRHRRSPVGNIGQRPDHLSVLPIRMGRPDRTERNHDCGGDVVART
ncbi:hypothetical protein RAJCM14343_1740 [Rhodococcus aetherivorans]|uniref:Uncharacterized protein n=1 Tax=Rhodococcus aetherivorans TaxID=191292 RepID=A0ABQ0YJ24_9NOCA|nr:hypothetical protein RAJCM14343_1740 [Rhodococcus aetherivorans]